MTTLTKTHKWDKGTSEVLYVIVVNGRVERRSELHMDGKVQHSIPKVAALRGTVEDFVTHYTSAGWTVVDGNEGEAS